MEKLNTILFYSLEKAIKSYRQFAQRNIVKAGFDITIDQWLVLKSLLDQPEISQQELATHIFKDVASITRIIELLVQKEYIARDMNTVDRRRFRLTITKQGKAVLSKLEPLIQHNRATALKGLSPRQIEPLQTALNKIIDNTNHNDTYQNFFDRTDASRGKQLLRSEKNG